MPEELRPWRNRPVPKGDEGAYVDAQGVRMFYNDPKVFINGDGKLYDHPVTQIQYGLGCLASYRTTGDGWFLTRAKAQAQRQIDRRVEARGAWYFPYPFNYTHNEHSGLVFTAPWYSGMAQGEAISLFVQLAQLTDITEEERTLYLAAADGAFASLLCADDTDPWVVNKDSSGFFWIQEYPVDAPGTSDYTFNGMIFARSGCGLLPANPQSAGTATVGRRPDHHHQLLPPPAQYPLGLLLLQHPPHRAVTYHHHHIDLFMQLQWFSGHFSFARNMDQLLDDYPYPGLVSDDLPTEEPSPSPRARTLSTNTPPHATGAYDPAKDDAETATKQVTFSRDTAAPASMRRRIHGRGVYYRISAGAYTAGGSASTTPSLPARTVVDQNLPTRRTLTFPANTPRRRLQVRHRRLNRHHQDRPMGPSLQRPLRPARHHQRPPDAAHQRRRTHRLLVWQGNVTTDGL